MNKGIKLFDNSFNPIQDYFEYPVDTVFSVCMKYTQIDGEEYKFFGDYTLKDLDIYRIHLITGEYEKDLKVFYKQLMSDIFKNYGKLRKGYELVKVNDTVIYDNTYKLDNFRFEKILDSDRDGDYLDVRYKPGMYFVS